MYMLIIAALIAVIVTVLSSRCHFTSRRQLCDYFPHFGRIGSEYHIGLGLILIVYHVRLRVFIISSSKEQVHKSIIHYKWVIKVLIYNFKKGILKQRNIEEVSGF